MPMQNSTGKLKGSKKEKNKATVKKDSAPKKNGVDAISSSDDMDIETTSTSGDAADNSQQKVGVSETKDSSDDDDADSDDTDDSSSDEDDDDDDEDVADEADQTQPFFQTDSVATPSAKRKRWTDEEIESLKHLLSVHGRNFGRIAQDLDKGETQIKSFYSNYRTKKHNLASFVAKVSKATAPASEIAAAAAGKKGTSTKRKQEDPSATEIEAVEKRSKLGEGTVDSNARFGDVEHVPLIMSATPFSKCKSFAIQDPSGQLLVFDLEQGFRAVRDDGISESETPKKKNKKKSMLSKT